jgi:hypothetical protein
MKYTVRVMVGINSRMRSTTTKDKRSFTLSCSSVVFLERLRKERKAASTSFVLDELIREAET